ncbi:MAG: isoprenylcysteine carboxylmethyltransferase family protein [Candidatus Acidiferrales bacterium]|jgi:protein-S-isoprenylcysteine O-methyltransferase Ste14|nr:isoprenylcysteine carboxylmethyltransferase family protein [Candidatus Acidoferrales bacterium]
MIPIDSLVGWLWLAFLLYWFAMAFIAKRAKQKENYASRILRILVLFAAAKFLFGGWDLGPLDRRFVPASFSVAVAGAVLTVLGMALAIWARVYLAGNWSGIVTLKKDHELIRTGPYARIRHPIYTGFQLALTGTALAIGQWRAIVALAIVLAAHFFKARKEEEWLAREFGPAFDEHRSRTGMFLPRLS